MPDRRAVLLLALAVVSTACGRDEQALAATRPLVGRRIDVPVEIYPLRIPGDEPGYLLLGPDGALPKMVYLHGMCSDGGRGDVMAFQYAAHAHGGLIGVVGDIPCIPGTDQRKYTADIDKLDARIRAAFAALNAEAEDLVLIGHSQGAYLGERLAEAFPGRYSRLVLIGAPTIPSASRLRHARAAVMICGELDATQRMKQGAENLASAGVPSTYLQMPGARHGQLSDAERIFGEAFTWLEANAKPKTL